MTDIKLNSDNDLLVVNGQLVLIDTEEELIRQRIMLSLNTFTNTWFENVNFGINQDLVFAKGTNELLDQDIKTIVAETTGVIQLLNFSSRIDPTTRVYTCDFEYETSVGDIVSVANVGLPENGIVNLVGVFNDGIWDYAGVWDDEFIWAN